MADSSEKTARGRGLGRPWPKGQSGNPSGRPSKSSTLLSAAFAEALAEVDPATKRTYAELIARKAVRLAAKKTNKLSSTLILAISEFADRTEGKPKQYTELEVKDHADPEARATRLAELLASGNQADSQVVTAGPEDRTRKPS